MRLLGPQRGLQDCAEGTTVQARAFRNRLLLLINADAMLALSSKKPRMDETFTALTSESGLATPPLPACCMARVILCIGISSGWIDVALPRNQLCLRSMHACMYAL